MLKKAPGAVIYSLPFIFILLAFYFPLANLFITGLKPDLILGALNNEYYIQVFFFTLKQAFYSAFFSMIPGIAGAWLLANYKIPGKNIIKAVTTVPFVLPPILAVLGFVLLFGNNGLINNLLSGIFKLESPPLKILYSFRAIILAHVFYNFPLFVRLVTSAWEKISVQVIEAAESLGASRSRVFMTAVLPQLIPPVIAAFSLIFILCFMSFAVILVLGGGPKYTTIEVEIYKLARINLDFNSACALAILQSSVTFSFLFIYSFFQKKKSMITEAGNYSTLIEKKPNPLQTGIIIIFFSALFILIILPLLMIVLESFKHKSGWGDTALYSLHWYRKSFSEAGLKPFFNSLFLALINTMLCLFISLTALSFLKKKNTSLKIVIETFFVLSIGVSSIILSLSYMKTIADFSIKIPGIILLSFAHCIAFIPFVFKSISVFYDRLDSSLIETAESIGADKRRIILTVEIPAVRNGIITGSILSFALSMGEVNSTLMLAPASFPTIPVTIYRMIASYNFNQACAAGSILIVICAVSFLLIEKTVSMEQL